MFLRKLGILGYTVLTVSTKNSSQLHVRRAPRLGRPSDRVYHVIPTPVLSDSPSHGTRGMLELAGDNNDLIARKPFHRVCVLSTSSVTVGILAKGNHRQAADATVQLVHFNSSPHDPSLIHCSATGIAQVLCISIAAQSIPIAQTWCRESSP